MKRPEVYTFRTRIDPAGNLGFLEALKDIPFEIKRIYWLYDVPEQQLRGDHAHKTGEQVIICSRGKITVTLESRKGDHFDYTLDTPEKGLYIPPLWWGKMIFSDNAMLIGVASDVYSEEDYIRDKSRF